MPVRKEVDGPGLRGRRHPVIGHEVQSVQDRGGNDQRHAEAAQLLPGKFQDLFRPQRPVGVHQSGEESEQRHPDVHEQIGEVAVDGAVRHVQP